MTNYFEIHSFLPLWVVPVPSMVSKTVNMRDFQDRTMYNINTINKDHKIRTQ